MSRARRASLAPSAGAALAASTPAASLAPPAGAALAASTPAASPAPPVRASPRWAALAASILAALALDGCASTGGLAAEVASAEAARQGSSEAIARALASPDPALRVAGLRALARAGEAGTSSRAIARLADPDPEVSTWAAFALGELAEPAGEAALRRALASGSGALDPILRALGRSGTATVAPDVAARLDDARPGVRAAAAIALGLLAKRLGSSFPAERHARRVAPRARDASPEVRFAATYALMRMPGPTAAVALIASLGSADPELRATAARGLGASLAAPQALDAVLDDLDWRVRVEVARSLGAIGRADADERLAAVARLGALMARELDRMRPGGLASGTALHPLLAAVAAAGELGAEGARAIAELERSAAAVDGPDPADLARLECAIAFVRDRAEGTIDAVKRCGGARIASWRREQMAARLRAAEGSEAAVEALAAMYAAHERDEDASRVRVAAVEALAEIDRASAVDVLARLLDAADPYVASAAADALGRPERARLLPAGLVARLGRALARQLKEPDPGLSVAVLDAIGGLGPDARSLVPDLAALARDPRPAIRRRAAKARASILLEASSRGAREQAPASARDGEAAATEGATAPVLGRPPPRHARARLRLRTTRGPIELELFGDVAPGTTGALTALVRAGFYDGKTFHRVVSDFVVQGGCPRGDGNGGPGYAIDEEISPGPFTRGTVGIATSGRDTGGSQLFIMHAYNPHLDGGYARVGVVLSGMEVVDALQEDDRILDARTP